MKFSEEYKKSAENMNPDRQTIDRMKAAVLKELQEHPDAPAQPRLRSLRNRSRCAVSRTSAEQSRHARRSPLLR